MPRSAALLPALWLSACSFGVGGLYMGTGAHPHVNFAATLDAGPAEVLVAPTTQNGVNDLFSAGLYPQFGPLVVGAGWAWWQAWGACGSEGYNCEKTWSDDLTAGIGLKFTHGHAVLEVRGQAFVNAPFDAALLFTIGVTP